MFIANVLFVADKLNFYQIKSASSFCSLQNMMQFQLQLRYIIYITLPNAWGEAQVLN